MLSTLKSNRKSILATVVVVFFTLLTLYFYQRSHVSGPNGEVEASVLDGYVNQLRQNPYDGSVLLRSARHHYFYVRQQLNNEQDGLNHRAMIERGLEHYLRILSVDDWTLSRRDYFYCSYLYYQLAQTFGDPSRRMAYLNRSKEMALQSYEHGYRSPELITLLGNLHYHTGEYDVALDYYTTLGDDVQDPEILFNKGWVHRAEGDYDRALELIERAVNRLPEGTSSPRRHRYRLAAVRVQIDRGEYRNAINRLQSMPDYNENPRALTLYANALIELGFEPEARRTLERVLNQDGAPEQARRLLNQINSDDADVRS